MNIRLLYPIELPQLAFTIERAQRFAPLLRYVHDLYGDAYQVCITKQEVPWSSHKEYRIEVQDEEGYPLDVDLALPYWKQVMERYPEYWEHAYTEQEEIAAASLYLLKHQVPQEYGVHADLGTHLLYDLPRLETIRLYIEEKEYSHA